MCVYLNSRRVVARERAGFPRAKDGSRFALRSPSWFFDCEGNMKQFLLGVLLVSGAAVVRAAQPVTVSVYPTVASVHASARVMVRVDAHEMNRKLVWEIDGADYYRSSSIQLDGASAPRSFSFMVQNVPAGEYQVRATIVRNNNSSVGAQTSLAVVGIQSLGN
jgi:hypothetical protein